MQISKKNIEKYVTQFINFLLSEFVTIHVTEYFVKGNFSAEKGGNGNFIKKTRVDANRIFQKVLSEERERGRDREREREIQRDTQIESERD